MNTEEAAKESAGNWNKFVFVRPITSGFTVAGW
jgi:hypothetical protein